MKEFFSKFKSSLAAKCFALLLSLLVTGNAFAQNKVSGVVTDESGLPLTGVTVVVTGTNNGTTTDPQGRYSIAAKNGSTLDFTYLGMVSERKSVGGGEFPPSM